MNNYLRIGEIVRAHGVQGAVKVVPLTDDPHRFLSLSEAYLEQDGGYRPVRVHGAKLLNDGVSLVIDGVKDRNAAELLRGSFLAVDRAHAVTLPKDHYFIADLIGCETFDTRGRSFGKVTDVLELPANDVYEIANGAIMVPALKRVLFKVDTQERRIVFDASAFDEVACYAD